MPKKTRPWQQSFRQLPPSLLFKARSIGPSVQLGCVKEILPEDLPNYTHLGLVSEHAEASTWLYSPSPGVGIWSRRSAHGWTEVHTHLPKEDREVDLGPRPHWGDWSRGSHTIVQTRQCYPKTEHSPQHLEFSVSVEPTARGSLSLTCLLNEPLDVNDADFETLLFRRGNFVQENLGGVDVFPVGATREEYLKSMHVNWTILPLPDESPLQILEGLLQGSRTTLSPSERDRVLDRVEMLYSLKPHRWIWGREGFQRYFGAELAKDLILFENLKYGNAIYIFEEDWETVSQLSRTELLSGSSYRFTRIRHTRNWKQRLWEELARRLGSPPPQEISSSAA